MSDNDTALGIGENIEGALCYLFGWITGLFFLVIEKENKFIRFHAMQSFVVYLGLFIINMAIGWIPIIGWLILFLTILGGLILWVLLMYKAYQGELYKLPRVGDFVEEKVNS
ncbi:MAG: DUF4870 domain-containing protein [Bacillota bacterium]